MTDKIVKDLIKKYKGKWIGVKSKKLIFISESHRGLYKKLKEKGISGVYVFYSPTVKEQKYEFLFLLLQK